MEEQLEYLGVFVGSNWISRLCIAGYLMHQTSVAQPLKSVFELACSGAFANASENEAFVLTCQLTRQRCPDVGDATTYGRSGVFGKVVFVASEDV